MLYLLAAVGAISVTVLLWRAFVANPPEDGQDSPTRPQRPFRPRPNRAAPVAPDDDPDFLRQLDERKKRPDSDGKQPPA